MGISRILAFCVLVMILCAGETNASFRRCYKSCMESQECLPSGPYTTIDCVFKCLHRCIGKSSTTSPQTQHNPQLQCATDHCTQFGRGMYATLICLSRWQLLVLFCWFFSGSFEYITVSNMFVWCICRFWENGWLCLQMWIRLNQRILIASYQSDVSKILSSICTEFLCML